MTNTITEASILSALKEVRDPDLDRDIVSLGFVKNLKIDGGRVAFDIELTTPACPVRDVMKEDARKRVAALAGVQSVDIRMTSQVRSSFAAEGRADDGVRNIIAVASGKGGVGKSTVSANLAVALTKLGAKVGLMDADIYGPSIPTILGIKTHPSKQGERIIPVDAYGVKVISMGFFVADGEAAILRGPMLHKLMEQFLRGVEWGNLDYLIIDLPPGTGDVQLSLCQMTQLTGAVVVSTPQDVALRVAQKAIVMFKKLNCPVLGMVENMSHYVCGKCGHEDDIFGSGGAKTAASKLGIPFLGEIPLTTGLRKSADEGRPPLVSDPGSALSKNFTSIAEALAAQVSIRAMSPELSQETQINF